MTSLPAPPTIKSGPARPRISSSPSKPFRLSRLSVPESGPPLFGQPGRSFVVKTTLCFIGSDCNCSWSQVPLMVRVPSHRASSSESVAWGELPCSFLLEVSERVPAQPTASRKTSHPIRKATTKAISCPWRATTPSPSSHVLLATSTSKHATQLAMAHLYGGLFTEVTLLWSSGVGSGTDLGLVHRHCGRETATVSGQHAVDLPGYVALQTADDLSFALALLCAP